MFAGGYRSTVGRASEEPQATECRACIGSPQSSNIEHHVLGTPKCTPPRSRLTKRRSSDGEASHVGTGHCQPQAVRNAGKDED